MDVRSFAVALGEYRLEGSPTGDADAKVIHGGPWTIQDPHGNVHYTLRGYGHDELTALVDLWLRARDGCKKKNRAFVVGKGEGAVSYFIDEDGDIHRCHIEVDDGEPEFVLSEPKIQPEAQEMLKPLHTFPDTLVRVHPRLNHPILQVRHADLKVWDPESAYKRCCPACNDGVLLVNRDSKDYHLLPVDRCLACGQHFIYTDIDDMNRREGFLASPSP